MRSPLLVLTLSFGMGHVSAAQSVAEEWRKQTGSQALVWDAIEYFPAWFRLVYVRPYWWMIRYWPSLWRKLFQSRLAEGHRKTFPHFLLKAGARRLLQNISSVRPGLIVAAEVGASEIASIYKSTIDGCVSIAALVTDFQGEPAWVQPGVDIYIVPSAKVAEDLRRWGALPESIEVAGIPVRASFHANLLRAREDLGLSTGHPVVLLMAGGMGPARLDRIAVELNRLSNEPIQIVAVAGKDQGLLHRLQALRLPRVTLLVNGWTDHIEQYMAACNLLITKPGALTLAEAEAMSLPTIVFDPLPGPEEENLRSFLGRGAGFTAGNPTEIAQLALDLLRQGFRRKYGRSNPTSTAAKIVLRLQRLTGQEIGGMHA
ncbi:MAG TPA: hypothetical protein VGK99_14935 [Acidobacteriota bacterium]|jgi:processive 1,2-diacylglycerol beta-glucosyltransferase